MACDDDHHHHHNHNHDIVTAPSMEPVDYDNPRASDFSSRTNYQLLVHDGSVGLLDQFHQFRHVAFSGNDQYNDGQF